MPTNQSFIALTAFSAAARIFGSVFASLMMVALFPTLLAS
jgi:hypothetical protein